MMVFQKTQDTIVVDRSHWRHYNAFPRQGTLLRNAQGNMCCLGFVGQQLGVESLRATGPAATIGWNVDGIFVRLSEDGCRQNTRLTCRAIGLNDDALGLVEREMKLIELFKEHDLELEFHGRYTEDTIGLNSPRIPATSLPD